MIRDWALRLVQYVVLDIAYKMWYSTTDVIYHMSGIVDDEFRTMVDAIELFRYTSFKFTLQYT